MQESFGVILVLAAVLLTFFFYMVPIRLWLAATFAGVHIGIFNLIGMRIRRVTPAAIVNPMINAHKAGLKVSSDQLEAHYLAGGNVNAVITALVSADKANIPLDFQRAAAIDLAGRNVLEAVHTSVNPRVIDCPQQTSGSAMLDAVAKDGIRLLVKARVTVRANLDRLVGGATEETIIARVGQGIVSAIGSSDTYKDVLENPDRISRKVLESGLDSQTAFEIVSIDIADVSVAGMGNVANVGALLETERAEADKKLRQAEAEGRRATAVAREQEMKALTQEMRAKVVEAEAQIPLAMAEAFRSGNLGVMDYYHIKNIQADTDMRKSISDSSEPNPPHGSTPKIS
ncbi:MAG: flotillin-like protein FloA [Candidatus Omnitrophica bacterium]|nr:flotillin-like protein FloA [bacterium]MCL4734953.1 flotillin-like protein FloA [Candidatus Omnitrophota bacterium]